MKINCVTIILIIFLNITIVSGNIVVENVDTIWNITAIPASADVIDPGEAKPQNVSNIFIKDVDTIWKQDLKESVDLIPLTELIMNETSSTNETLFEYVISHLSILNTSITGGLNGTLNFSSLEVILINSGSFTGKGFSKGNWSANIDGVPYEGYWQGMLFKKPDERKIYIKGTVSGGLKGVVEGYLVESVNGSYIYDNYQAVWTINQMGVYPVFTEVDVNGTVNYQNQAEFSSEIYALQSYIVGKASGHYNVSLNMILTHVRINDATNPYYGQGFSIFSYVSESGSGEGWTYDKTISPGVEELKGPFTEPLRGIASGLLDESRGSRALSISLERIDVGSEPMAYPYVKILGPGRASPGQRISYLVEYGNYGLKTAEDNEIIILPSFMLNYTSGSSGIVYDSIFHLVYYNLTKIPPHTINYLSVQADILWGLQQGTSLSTSIFIIPYNKTNIILDEKLSAFSVSQLNSQNTPWWIQSWWPNWIPMWARNTLNAIWTGISYAAPMSEFAGALQTISEDLLGILIMWSQTEMKTASGDPESPDFCYWTEIVGLLQGIHENQNYITDHYGDSATLGSVVQELKQQCNFIPLPPDTSVQIDHAHDPNIKYGPNGFIHPDQILNYIVEFENEGEGIAFGVYFTDTLDQDLNDSTLEIGPLINVKNGSVMAPPGVYDNGTRTITWFVGEVGSKEGGYSNISIKPRSDPEEGTEIINYATVYFPSVPETTKTNGIVSIIDVSPPIYFNVSQSKSNATVRDFVEVSAFWKDGVQLNHSWVETNESGAWQNISQVNLSGTVACSKFSIQTKNEGTTCWRIHANDTAGNENTTNEFCFNVIIDTMPPQSITNLSLEEVGATRLNFTWTNPTTDPDFNHTELYLDGTFINNIAPPQNHYNFTGLQPDTIYELGTHTVDNSGNVNETWVNATARTLPSGVVPPVADCGADKLRCENVGSPVQFNASASYDPDGAIVSYDWGFGDGTNATGVTPVHKYNTYRWNGTAYQPFSVNLTVTDNDGMVNSTSQKAVIWIPGDANGDGKVNILDASVVGLKWGSNELCADLNNDGKVNILDASIIGLNWGKSAQIKT